MSPKVARAWVAVAFWAGLVGDPAATGSETSQRLEAFLTTGRVGEARQAFAESVAAQPLDDEARFALGIAQFLQAVERLGQGFYRYGLEPPPILAMAMPYLRLPLPQNPSAEEIAYDDLRGVINQWAKDLREVERTLGQLSEVDIRLPLRIGLIRLDWNSDGSAADSESLWQLYVHVNVNASRIPPQRIETFEIGFDRADAYWLQGYCHLLSATAEFVLAHDFRDLFERTAHLFFPKAQTPYAFLKHERPSAGLGSYDEILDALAWFHLIRCRVVEPERMRSAHSSLLAMIDCSRRMWKAIAAEGDNENEWIPGERQTSVLPNGRMTAEMIAGWHDFLSEAEALLRGQKLVPFWRGHGGQGVNLRRVFLEPQTFDLVLWIQGTAAAPYLSEGPLTSPDTWRRFEMTFRGQFVGFALWLN